MLGHIHKSQQWERAGRVVAYPGSIGRFHYGEEGDKGFLMWNVEVGSAQADLVVTPSRKTICVDFDGPPDMQRLTAIALDATDKFVRIRWQVDEEHKQSVDRDAIAALFGNAAQLKVEARILPVVRSRAQGISLETSIDRKLERWCEHADVVPAPMLDRLQLLETGDAEAIAAGVLARMRDAEAAHPFATDGLPALSSMCERAPVTVQKAPDDDVGDNALPMLDATVEIVGSASASQLSWLNDDLFAA
jgi:exonuclease SbcD